MIGKLVRILKHLKVTRYLDFTLVDGSYVTKDGKVQKVPASAGEALLSVAYKYSIRTSITHACYLFSQKIRLDGLLPEAQVQELLHVLC